MDLPEALAAFLQSKTSLTELVRERIYDGQLPEGTPLPTICITRIAGTDNPHQLGGGTLMAAHLQVSCYALSSRKAGQVAKQVRDAVTPALSTDAAPGFAGVQRDPAKPAESLNVQRALHAGDVELKEAPQTGGEVFHIHRAIDFEIWYSEVSVN